MNRIFKSKIIPLIIFFIGIMLFVSCGAGSDGEGVSFLQLNINCPDVEDLQQKTTKFGVERSLEDIVIIVITAIGGTPQTEIEEQFEPSDENIVMVLPQTGLWEFIIMGKDIFNQTICMGGPELIFITRDTTVIELDCIFVFEICNDGIDNDGDGDIDCVDPDCETSACSSARICSGGQCVDEGGDDDDDTQDNTEDNFQGQCSDSIDNDNDGPADCDDPDCENAPICNPPPPPPDPEPQGPNKENNCDDEQDNDNDGDTDCEDSDCFNDPCCNEFVEICGNNIDDDCDSLIDCADTFDCPDEEFEISCTDNIDNDCDGNTDCSDSNCICNQVDCSPVPSSCFIGKPGFCVE